MKDTDQDTDQEPKPEKKSKNIKKPMFILLAIVLIFAAIAGAYWYGAKQANKQKQQLQTQIDQLKEQAAAAQKSSEDAKTANNTTTTNTTTTPTNVPSQALIDTIKAVFASGNSAALEGYMANPVSVIVAASEGIGSRTPLLATQDITGWMAHATDPWNFSVPSATLTTWRNGFYKQYFPSNAVIGKSDNMVISFSFNSANKISTVLLVNNVDVLTQ